MSYEAFAALKEHAEIETIKKLTPEQINDLLTKQNDKINDLKNQIIDLKACLRTCANAANGGLEQYS